MRSHVSWLVSEIGSENGLTMRLVKVETQTWRHFKPVLVNEAAKLVFSTLLKFNGEEMQPQFIDLGPESWAVSSSLGMLCLHFSPEVHCVRKDSY